MDEQRLTARFVHQSVAGVYRVADMGRFEHQIQSEVVMKDVQNIELEVELVSIEELEAKIAPSDSGFLE